MDKDNQILEKSFNFSIRVVNLSKTLQNDKEYILSKQLLRSGTSIGANVNEAQAAQSKRDFVSKMSIAAKEARESYYWINLLIKTNYIDAKDQHVQTLLEQSEELIKMLTSIVRTGQNNL